MKTTTQQKKFSTKKPVYKGDYFQNASLSLRLFCHKLIKTPLMVIFKENRCGTF